MIRVIHLKIADGRAKKNNKIIEGLIFILVICEKQKLDRNGLSIFEYDTSASEQDWIGDGLWIGQCQSQWKQNKY